MVTWPSNTKEIIDEIRETIGRPIEIFVTVSGELCPICTLDPIKNKSVNPFCPVCSGVGYLNTVSGYETLAHIRWGRVNDDVFYPGARIVTGDCKATIEYTEEALDVVDNSIYVIADHVKLYIDSYDLRGVQPVNRIVLDLVQNPRDKR